MVGLGELGSSPANAATAREQRPRRSGLGFADPEFVGPAAELANPGSTISPKTCPVQRPQVTAVTSTSGVRLPESVTAASNGESAQSPTDGGSGKIMALATPATLRPENPGRAVVATSTITRTTSPASRRSIRPR